ncbi:hypothetical protein NKG99_20540 [Mesorhizobium sp. M1409]|uniref:hypothetical protein n=1 Tax=Mesorhizobium sp. M1409 TaxID=2957100 RepID=UPI00333842C8
MSDRAFQFAKVTEDGRPLSALRITCSNCPQTTLFVQRGSIRKPPTAAEQFFRNHGWRVGSRQSGDLCPRCIEAEIRRKNLKLVEKEEMSEPALKADPPRTMTREDRRIINDKLDTVYSNDCYENPWTDAKVARDLGVPQAWVAEVRDQFFGPEGSNPEIEAFLGQVEPLMAEAKKYTADASQQLVKSEETLRAAQTLVRAVGDLSGRISQLERTAHRLEREIGK